MSCDKCGAEITSDVQVCPKCGAAVKTIADTTVNNSKRIRHGFTTVWLILGIVYFSYIGLGFGFGGVMVIIDPPAPGPFVPDPLFSLFQMFACFAQAISLFFIFKWKKNWFWGFIGASSGSILLQIVNAIDIMNNIRRMIGNEKLIAAHITSSHIVIILSIILIISFWGVLHIRKNGKSAWSQLE